MKIPVVLEGYSFKNGIKKLEFREIIDEIEVKPFKHKLNLNFGGGQ